MEMCLKILLLTKYSSDLTEQEIVYIDRMEHFEN